MKDQDIDKLFADGFSDQEVNPPASVWKGIEAKLDSETIVPEKKVFNWQVWAIAASLVLVLGISIKLFFWQTNVVEEENQELTQIIQSEINPVQEVVSEKVIEPKHSIPESENKEIKTLPGKVKVATTIKKKTNSSIEPIVQKNNNTDLTDHPSKGSFEKVSPTKEMNLVNQIDLDEPNHDKAQLSGIEVSPIQPLVNVIEQEEVMYAEAKVEPKQKQNIFTNILNTITENINPSSKSVKFSSDDEGTIRIDLYNSIAKTRK